MDYDNPRALEYVARPQFSDASDGSDGSDGLEASEASDGSEASEDVTADAAGHGSMDGGRLQAGVEAREHLSRIAKGRS